ncbi:MAG: hypothetical protein SGPRY_006074, partial [Prymnesium sp.]
GDELSSIQIAGGSSVRIRGNDELLNGTVFTMQSVPVDTETFVQSVSSQVYSELNQVPSDNTRNTVEELRIAAPEAEIFAAGNVLADAAAQHIDVLELAKLRGTESKLRVGGSFLLLRSDGAEYAQEDIQNATFQIESIATDSNGVHTSMRGVSSGELSSNGSVSGPHTVFVDVRTSENIVPIVEQTIKGDGNRVSMNQGDLVFATSDPAQVNALKGSLDLGDLAIGRQPFTWAAWYKNAGHFVLYLYFDPLGQFWVGDPKGVALALPSGLTRMSLISTGYDLGETNFNGSSPLNKWTHIAFTSNDTGTYKLYINGVLQITHQTAGSVELTESPYWIGGQIDVGQTYDHTQEFMGAMRDVVWDAINRVSGLEARLRLLESLDPVSGETADDSSAKVLYRARISAGIFDLGGTVVHGLSHGQWTEDINRTAATILVDGHKLTAPREGHYRNNALGLNREVISGTAYNVSDNEVTLSHNTDVLFMEAGSFVFVEMNVTNGFLLAPNGTWVILEEL